MLDRFDDCLKLGKRIDEGPYLLPNPEILSKGPEDEIKIPSSQHLEGAVVTRPCFIPHPTDSQDRVLQVFDGKRIMLADDLQLSTRLRSIIEDLVVNGGGSITNSVARADILVCQYRDGKDYITASRAEKDVGNLSWLYYLITNNQWTSPFKRLLHYPVPRDGIPGFKDFRITLSNYGGEARLYLENLVNAAGGTFTKSMKMENTHLITARIASEKCDAAQEWGVNMINHLWIEESYAKCAIQPLTNPRYTHFPRRTNLGEVIGQTQFNKQALEEKYFPRDGSESPELFKKQRNIMQNKDSNVTVSRPDTAEDLQLPTSNIKPKSTPSRAAPKISTPFTSRLTGKENETPSSTSSRGAKDRALSRLSDLASDVALYEKEKKRAGTGIWGGKRAADQVEKEKEREAHHRQQENMRKRLSSPTDSDDDDEVSIDGGHESKKQKTGRAPLPVPQMRILITSYARWIDKVGQEEADRVGQSTAEVFSQLTNLQRKLRALGILVSQDPHTCTHLVAPSIIRTQKFLTALASGCVLLSSAFIDKCLEKDELPPIDKFLLKDTVNENKWNIKLKDVLARAKSNKKRLLHNVVVYCTSEIPNGPDTYKAIVEANGGIFSIYRGRSGGTMIRPSKEGEQNPTDGEPVYLLSGLKPEETRLWPKFKQMVKDGKMEPRVVATEWILYTAMAQEMVWKDEYLIDR